MEQDSGSLILTGEGVLVSRGDADPEWYPEM